MTTPVNSNNSPSLHGAHNGRAETTMRDVFEHVGNREFGSAIALDIATGEYKQGR